MLNLLNLDIYILDLYSLTVADIVVHNGTFKAMNEVNALKFAGKGTVTKLGGSI